MDTIGSSTKLMWFFVCIYSYPILLLIFSVAIWSYNRFKRLSFISYITGTILTVFILLIDINNLVAKFIKGNFMYTHKSCIINMDNVKTIDIKNKVIVFSNNTKTDLLSRKYLK